VQIVLQVAEALRMMHEEGLKAVYQRHNEMAQHVRESCGALGLALQCPALTRHSATMTAIALPAGVDPKSFRDRIKARGILTAAGLDRYASVGFRIGHMGDIRMADVERTLDAVREASAGNASRAMTLDKKILTGFAAGIALGFCRVPAAPSGCGKASSRWSRSGPRSFG
jgi:aspartate aminotransferase-like enzyme